MIAPSLQDQLQFQVGDVLGFYVESNGADSDNDNGVVLLNNSSHTDEVVYFGHVDTRAQTSQTDSCPYPIGTNGVLNLMTVTCGTCCIDINDDYILPPEFDKFYFCVKFRKKYSYNTNIQIAILQQD